MSRRVSLPAADDLFRGNRHRTTPADARADDGPAEPPTRATVRSADAETAAETAARKSSGRVRHDEKMTVYVTADELLDIEHARLSLRRHQGLAVDRGRLVREAIAIVLADLEAQRRRQRAGAASDRSMTGLAVDRHPRSSDRRRPAPARSPYAWTTSRARSTCC